MERIEVRCCFQPQKLLGWLPVDYPKIGNSYEFPIDISIVNNSKIMLYPSRRTESINLKIERIMLLGVSSMALKAEGAPLEMLRKISTFKENKNGQDELFLDESLGII